MFENVVITVISKGAQHGYPYFSLKVKCLLLPVEVFDNFIVYLINSNPALTAPKIIFSNLLYTSCL